ncbi:hypothetical protein Z517_00201 [Fonsecaea pedrosoi CBS 271.37]|uniref:F-box domain-containing protein n=1 Tax=Fonsecaea pedrosoi CBS 271.37 TaxID=1442368 RepID=A0A0D2GUZ6_9EURO|nr:uncharacterized protein Z517_00201 [Fonsecaea pedrosoi CBS 271.37]KIW84813.1 hypothetical protein Z517_00201 [Fonsecaea pedrosoi CBS 271.37]
MSLRRPPRLNESGDGEHAPALQVAEGETDDFTSLLARTERRASSAIKVVKKKDSLAETEADPAYLPFTTDFGPNTLVEYLRAEVDKLRRERDTKAAKGKGKGKQKETLEDKTSSLLHPSSAPSTTHGLFSPSAAPELTERVNGLPPAGALATRRSQRLARKGSLNQANQVASDQKTPTLFQPAQPIPFLSDLPQQNSHLEDAPTSLPSGASHSRATTFEEHTKSKRMAVRNTAHEDSVSPLRARLRQRRHSKALSLSGSSAVMSTDVSASRAEAHHPGPLQHEGTPASHPISQSENDPTLSVGCLPSSRAQEPTGNKVLQASSHNSVHCVQDRQASLKAPPPSKDVVQSGSEDQSSPLVSFKYSSLIPETIPPSEKKQFMHQVRHAKRNSAAGNDWAGNSPAEPQERTRLSHAGRTPLYAAIAARRGSRLAFAIDDILHPAESLEDVPDPVPEKQYPRLWKPSIPPSLSPISTSSTRARSFKAVKPLKPESSVLQKIDADLWTEVISYLSTQDVRNLRLASKSLARVIAPIQFRNVVVNFDRHFFDAGSSDWNSRLGLLPSDSMFKKYGVNINKFGVSFEYDLQGLSRAKTKTIEKEQVAWFGKFTWPTEQYPRFPELQAIEDLVDHNRPLLKEALSHITKASELGLCIDSGHGWLEGPDISDMALFDRRTTKGSKVFGKTFPTEDVWVTFARNEYFRWAQQSTINGTIKALMAKQPPPEIAAREIRFLEGLKIRDIESFRRQDEQFDYDPECHVGGSPVPGVEALMDANGDIPNFSQALQVAIQRQLLAHARKGGRKLPQWPLIFSGHNLAAEHGGHCTFIQSKMANPGASPLLPGMLTEPQAQWLMETVWAQRAFLSAYTTAIITQKQNFKSIHTLRISKLSSGLLPSLELEEFWKSLSGLTTLEVLISPDWRQEHVTGDRLFARHMAILPSKAAEKFTKFLRRYIVKMESLHSLTIGYTGGGEHAVGMFARNKHVLPAPIVDNPGDWLFDNASKKQGVLITKFDHVRELKFQNCWFTPSMLRGFMKDSRDTSLHSLSLDSVSMTAHHDGDITAPTWNMMGRLHCLHPREDWTQEILPTGASWVQVLDAITPGKTLLAHKYDAGLVDRKVHPMPQATFRGHIQQIILNSCGYVKISVPERHAADFNQNAAVVRAEPSMDDALYVRKARFVPPLLFEFDPEKGFRMKANSDITDADEIMIEETSVSGEQYPWLGTLTQCIHPIEKRVLEEAWQMTFGWPNNLERWAAVEDGQSEGGTGRFSGVIRKTEQMMDEY